MIRTIALPIEPVGAETTGATVYERFCQQPDLLAIAVVDEDRRPIGIVERNAFFLKMAAEFGRALFAKRPIRAVMDPNPLITDAETTLDSFLARALDGSPSELLRGFIVVDQGRYLGVGTALNLLIGASEENVRRAQEMERLAADLRAREASFRLLFDDNPVPLFVFDRVTHRILQANEAAERAWSRDRSQLLASKITDFLTPPHRELAQRRLRGEIAGDEPPVYDMIDGRGRMREITSYVRPLTFDGRPALLAAVIDVSDRRQAEEALARARDAAEAANRAKSEFLANMSHEIRTPLNGVLGVAGALARTRLDERQRELVGVIESSAETLQVQLSDILDLARVEAGRLELTCEPFHMGEACRAVAELFRTKAEEKGLGFQVEVADSVERRVVGDAVRLKQILGNLLSNAIKFTSQGSVALRVGACFAGPDALGFVIEVADTGIGFDEAAKSRLFTRFQQADGSITRQFGGSGLGLSISAGLAQLMGGRLDAESEEGRGSTFRLELSLAAAPEAAPPPAPDAEGPQGLEAGAPIRVLLAEDHPINRKVVELIFDGLPVALAQAEDGAAALTLYRTQPFDVVLMDMQMPNMDGLAATRAIRALEAGGARPRTPVIMLSANALPEHEAAGLAAGADLYLTKPIEAGRLIEAVERALSLAGAQAAAA
ncbi:ATP-binding protein [Phenylobacterium terrae]|uniref:histidine kinase n=1 Tax=Phenylobacterium terrae TaxID=2665495 RepID=A0ABW4N113_9CAUL